MTRQEMLNEFSSLPHEAQRQVMTFIAFLRHNDASIKQVPQNLAYPSPKFYGCIDDETLIRHPQEQQSEREPLL